GRPAQRARARRGSRRHLAPLVQRCPGQGLPRAVGAPAAPAVPAGPGFRRRAAMALAAGTDAAGAAPGPQGDVTRAGDALRAVLRAGQPPGHQDAAGDRGSHDPARWGPQSAPSTSGNRWMIRSVFSKAASLFFDRPAVSPADATVDLGNHYQLGLDPKPLRCGEHVVTPAVLVAPESSLIVGISVET